MAIPTYDNFEVQPGVLQAPTLQQPVSAGENTLAATDLMQQAQQGMQLNQDTINFQLQEVERANALRVDDALNKAKEAQMRLMHDKDIGFNNIRGQAALSRPNGKPLSDEYEERFQQELSAISQTLNNPLQRDAFQMKAMDMVTGFKASAMQHEAREYQTYQNSVYSSTISNRQNEIGLNYDKPAVIDEAVDSIKSAAYELAMLNGKSAQEAEYAAREAGSKGHLTAVQSALQNKSVVYADEYLKRYAKDMSADDILQAKGVVTKEMNAHYASTVASEIMNKTAPKVVTSDIDRAWNIAVGTESRGRQFGADGKPLTSPKGAIGKAQVMPATAPEAAKLAGLPWDDQRYRNDPEYNEALGRAYFNEQLREFDGDLSKAYAAYNAGPGALKKAIKQSNAEATGDGWLKFMPKETRDYVAKNMNEYATGGGKYDKPTLYELQQQTRAAVGTDHPERLKLALDEVERQYTALEKGVKQAEDKGTADAMRAVLQNGGNYSALPADVRSNIPPDKVSSVMDFAKKLSKGDDNTNLQVYNQLASNMPALKSMSDDEFYEFRKDLSETDFKHFANERAKLLKGDANNSPGDLNNEAIKRTLDDQFRSRGIDPSPKDSNKAENMRLGSARRYINESILIEQARLGKKMSDAEISDHIAFLFSRNVQGAEGGWFGIGAGYSGAMLGMKPSDIPSATRNALKEQFKAAGIPNPSDGELLGAYWRGLQKNNTIKKPTEPTQKKY
jgi:soluble lytic murein transglycosylase